MAVKYSEIEITSLTKEPKPLPENYEKQIQLRPKRGHKEQELDLAGVNGSSFRLILRQSDYNLIDFSIILAVCPEKTTQLFRLRRYNGRSHEHTNRIEGDTFYDFHIHTATERYQELGAREDSYAERTTRFSDFHGALDCIIRDCGFQVPRNGQGKLFEDF